jgi:hypothetical protein
MNQKTNKKLTLFNYLLNMLFRRYLIRNRNPTESPITTLLDFQLKNCVTPTKILELNIYLKFNRIFIVALNQRQILMINQI